MYTATHIYTTFDDDGNAIIEMESQVTDIYAVAAVVKGMLEAPGGRSGTTLSLTVTCNEPPTLK